MKRTVFLLTIVALFAFRAAAAEGPEFRLGFIGCLTSYAGNYGTAVLEGAQLAVKELEAQGTKVRLIVEDDQSVSKNTVTAFVKLTSFDKVQGIIGGSWWLDAIVQQSEQANLPLLSCETLYNRDTVSGKTYFLLQGDLREWVRLYEPVVRARDFKRGAIVRYSSGFGATLAEEMKQLFSEAGRTFTGAIEYNDIQLTDASSVVLQLRRANPEVVYIDAQPAGLASLLKSMAASGMERIAVFTHSAAEDVLREKLYPLQTFRDVYFTRRVTFDAAFSEKFAKEYGRQPILNADLGYYAVHLLVAALKTGESVAALKSGLDVGNRRFVFDAKNLLAGTRQEVWRVVGADIERVKP